MKVAAGILVCSAVLLGADVPEVYRTVSRIVFVVPDAGEAAAAWARAGVPVERVEPLDAVYGRRIASVLFENVAADFIEAGGKGPLRDFAVRHKSGGFALVHRVPDTRTMEAELARLRKVGVRPALDIQWKNRGRFVFLDTLDQGKYSLALAVVPESNAPRPSLRVTQYAFVTSSLESVSSFWEKLGFPAMTFTHPDCSELVYRGRPGTFDMRLGWQRHGKVPYEWIQAVRGPSTYQDHVANHGEGFHHLASGVSDMDQAIAQWSGFGFSMVMSGAWGDKGKPGSGRFAYHDLDRCCGSEIELLWNFKPR